MLMPTRQPPPDAASPRSSRPPARRSADGRAGPSARSRARRIVVAAALLSLIPALVSFATTLAGPSNSSFFINAVEWVRDNGGRGLVNRVESIYYSLNAPAKGGPGLRALPSLAGVTVHPPSAQLRAVRHYYRPSRIRPVLSPALPGEGVWRATFAHGGRRPPVLITSFRPDPSYPRMVAGVAWIDQTQTTTWLYPGRLEPSVSLPSRGPMEVPARLRPRLVATFNSAFKLADSGGGFAEGGHTYAPMKTGLATFERLRSGRVDVIPWTGGPVAGAGVMYARQNLPLIVNHGRPNPNLSDGPEWGATLGNAIEVWRSAVGVDRHGDLIYAAAPIQTVGSLAAILIHAGAVRAMELDINTYWTSFITYRYSDAREPANLLASMDRSPLRYLTPDDRDFFAVYIR